MQISKMLLTPNKYSRPMTALKEITKIAVHYVGNAGSSANGNRNYFESLKNGSGTYASSHYIIGLDGEIIQCIPENEVAYCTNEANSYSISIENCHPKADGKFTEATRESLKELCADLCKRYGLDPLSDIIRHYDVSGKRCPLYWVTHPEDFVAFKKEVKTFMNNKGGLTVTQYEELKKEISDIYKEISDHREKVFNNINEIPEWAKPTVDKLIAKGALKGDDNGLNLSYTLLRQLVINDRIGVYDN